MSRKTLVIGAVCAAVIVLAIAALIYNGVRREKAVSALLADISGSDTSVRPGAGREIAAYRDGQTARRLVALLDKADKEQERIIIAALAAMGKPAVAPLLEELRGADPAWIERVTATAPVADQPAPGVVQALTAIGQPALPGLHDMLKSAGPGARALAASALGTIADPSSVDPLKTAMSDADAMVRAEAVWALGKTKTPAALDALLVAATDADAGVRKAMARSLGQFSNDRVAEPLSALARDAESEVSTAALLALGKASGPKSTDFLVERLKSPDADTRDAAARALGDAGDKRAVEALIAALPADNAWTRCVVLDSLRKLGDSRAVPAYIAALPDMDPAVRKAAGYALEGTADARARQPLLDALRTEEDSGVLCTLCYALSSYDDDESISALVTLCKHPEMMVRKAAVDSLSLSRKPAARQAVVAGLDDKAPGVRYKAVRCLRGMPNADAIDRLVALLRDGDGSVRVNAALALGECGGSKAVEPLIKALHPAFSGDDTAQAAAVGLSVLKDERAIAPLIEMLHVPEAGLFDMNTTAAYALLTIGGEKANSAVNDTVKDFDLADITANYPRYIRQGDAKAVTPLIVALVRSGDMRMAGDLYWSGSNSLKRMTEYWADSQDRLKELRGSTDSRERPKWESGE